ncbi:hypothetical protein CG740_31760 [Streptomyces sp. CB01201]|nr:hypothetical protein CG740_31760 [Streptomyces sp. CB01201]
MSEGAPGSEMYDDMVRLLASLLSSHSDPPQFSVPPEYSSGRTPGIVARMALSTSGYRASMACWYVGPLSLFLLELIEQPHATSTINTAVEIFRRPAVAM